MGVVVGGSTDPHQVYNDVRPFVRRSAPDWSGIWPTIVTHMRTTGKQQQRSISCYCLQLVLDGNVRFFSANGVDTVLGKDDLFLIEPDVPFFYHTVTNLPFEQHTINLIGPLTGAFIRSLGFDGDRLYFRVRDPETLAALFRRLMDLAKQHDVGVAHRIVSTIHEFPPACSELHARDDAQVSFVERVINYLHTHLEQGENIEQIASKFGVSRYTLFLRFREELGKPPSEVLTTLRIARAKQLLENTDLRVSEICWICGYGSVEHFIRQFREHAGEAPTSWRNSEQRHKRKHPGIS